MRHVTLASEDDFDGWRAAARALVAARVPAGAVGWSVGDGPADLFAGDAVQPEEGPRFAVPRALVDLASAAICHSDPERFALLHALLLRVIDAPEALRDSADPLVRRVEAMAKAVRRDRHKMHAFVRFREVAEGQGTRFVAWFEPEHHIVRSVAGFFVDRFASMRWSILTPALCLHWDGAVLTTSPGATRADAPEGDPLEATWKAYYAAIFNPARLKMKAMMKEMPKKYWRNMPETALVGTLVAGARERELAMIAQSRAPVERKGAGNIEGAWQALRDEAMACTRCDLHRCATQTVFGEGPLDAPILFVGEQPGDQEDLAGRPFVGPAGQLFDRALEEAGIDRARVYVTNAVKHFKYEQRGKRRLHSTPNAGEIKACRWWVAQERTLVRAPVTVALGATAVHSLFGKASSIAALRGVPHPAEEGEIWVTVHPSFLLRVPEGREEHYARFVADLRQIARRAAEMG